MTRFWVAKGSPPPLRAVEAACDQFRHTHLLAEPADGKNQLFAMVFEAQIGEQQLRGVDLVEVNDRDLIN